jgi:hypothetical protein
MGSLNKWEQSRLLPSQPLYQLKAEWFCLPEWLRDTSPGQAKRRPGSESKKKQVTESGVLFKSPPKNVLQSRLGKPGAWHIDQAL